MNRERRLGSRVPHGTDPVTRTWGHPMKSYAYVIEENQKRGQKRYERRNVPSMDYQTGVGLKFRLSMRSMNDKAYHME